MLGYFKDFIVNIFFIFSPLVFYPYIYKVKSKVLLYKFLLYLLFSCAIVITMSFPIVLHGLIYDFRSIPLVVGSLYGGPQVSILLFLTLVGYRFLIGNPSNLLYVIAIAPSFLMLLFSLRIYSSLPLYKKITISVILCTLVKLITFSMYYSFTHQIEMLLYQLTATFEAYLLQGIIIGLCVYLIEFLNKYFHMQEEVVKSEKMKIVSDMAASVAHEIRNPLTTVRGFIQLFGSAGLDEEKRGLYRKICLEELDRAQLIITDYLSLAKPDPEINETINVSDELIYLSNVLLTYANYNQIEINQTVSEDRALYITGDRYKFRQALINIGKNAIEAMNNGGILDIKAEKTGENVVIGISDNGTGMTPEQVNRLGTPYYSTKEKGTGLGTMVSFGIIKKMNGKIEVRSEIGRGTVYTLTFPGE